MNKKTETACLSAFLVSLIFISTPVGSTRYHNYTPKQAQNSSNGSLFLGNFQILCSRTHFWVKTSPLAFELAHMGFFTVYQLFRTLGYDFMQPLISLRLVQWNRIDFVNRKGLFISQIGRSRTWHYLDSIGRITSCLTAMRTVYTGGNKWLHPRLKAEKTDGSYLGIYSTPLWGSTMKPHENYLVKLFRQWFKESLFGPISQWLPHSPIATPV